MKLLLNLGGVTHVIDAASAGYTKSVLISTFRPLTPSTLHSIEPHGTSLLGYVIHDDDLSSTNNLLKIRTITIYIHTYMLCESQNTAAFLIWQQQQLRKWKTLWQFQCRLKTSLFRLAYGCDLTALHSWLRLLSGALQMYKLNWAEKLATSSAIQTPVTHIQRITFRRSSNVYKECAGCVLQFCFQQLTNARQRTNVRTAQHTQMCTYNSAHSLAPQTEKSATGFMHSNTMHFLRLASTETMTERDRKSSTDWHQGHSWGSIHCYTVKLRLKVLRNQLNI